MGHTDHVWYRNIILASGPVGVGDPSFGCLSTPSVREKPRREVCPENPRVQNFNGITTRNRNESDLTTPHQRPALSLLTDGLLGRLPALDRQRRGRHHYW